MNSFVRNAAAPLVLGLLVLSVGACKSGKKEEAGKSEVAASSTAAGASAPSLANIPGLETERKQVSYMIGMDISRSLTPVKDQIDVDTLALAIRNSIEGKPSLLTDEQAQAVGKAFSEKMQAKQAAEKAAQASKNLKDGQDFLAANKTKPGVHTTESGLQYEVIRPGNGPKPAPTDVVRVHYKGTLLDGTTFDSSYDRGQPNEFTLNQVIPGWTEGVGLMPVGSKYRLWIPANIAYGEAGQGPIGPNATLVFEVELLAIVK